MTELEVAKLSARGIVEDGVYDRVTYLKEETVFAANRERTVGRLLEHKAKTASPEMKEIFERLSKDALVRAEAMSILAEAFEVTAHEVIADLFAVEEPK